MLDEEEFKGREPFISDDNESEDAWWGYLQKNHKLSLKGESHFLFLEPIFSPEYPAALSRRLFSVPESEIWALLDRYLGKHKSWQLHAVMQCMVNYTLTLYYNNVYSSYVSDFPEADLEKVKFEFVSTHKRVVNAITGWLQVRDWELENEEQYNEPQGTEETQLNAVENEPVVQESAPERSNRPPAKLDFEGLCKAPFTPEKVDAVLREAGLIDAENNFHSHGKGKAGLPAAYRILVAKQKMHDRTNTIWSKLFGERYNVAISPATAKFKLGSPNVSQVFEDYCKSIENIVDGLDALDNVIGNLIKKRV